MTQLHPIRTPGLSSAQVGWLRPAIAVGVVFLIPALFALVFSVLGTPTVAGPPKDGTSYTMLDHVEMISVALAASYILSWMLAPFAVLALRAAAISGYAGWGSAVLSALLSGLPIVFVAMDSEVTSEFKAYLPHICAAIAVLGLSVWAVFWALMALAPKRNDARGI